jgi:hypothetical protein
MFRLLVLLCAGLFLALLVGGQDRGQLRFGLMNAPVAAKAPTPLPETPVEVTAAAFAPAKPVMVAPIAPVAVAVAVEPVVAAAPAFEPQVFYIDAKSVNVRSGPGKTNPVIARLSRDEAVLVVSQTDEENGWSLIRIEGDGVEGYVATQLLRQ